MPSPFPGMDPYLETPDIWPDLHASFAVRISQELNRILPRPYYAKLGMRPELGLADDEPPRRIRPERIPDEPLRHHFVEIRNSARGHALVTVIEIASPTNKRSGPDRRAYEAKRQEILDSDTSLIELDLLRGGQPLIGGPLVIEAVARLEPRPDYLVAVNRAWQRGPESQYQFVRSTKVKVIRVLKAPWVEGYNDDNRKSNFLSEAGAIECLKPTRLTIQESLQATWGS